MTFDIFKLFINYKPFHIRAVTRGHHRRAMRTIAVRFWILVCLIGLGVLPVLSQGGNRGTVEGFVTDVSGAALAAASATLGDAAKGTQLTSTTDSAGRFALPVVPSGSSTLRAEQQGFPARETPNVTVSIGAQSNL